MSAVVGGLTALELAQLFSALAGGSYATAQLIELIKKHIAAHPEDVERFKQEQPEMAARLFQQPDFSYLH